MKRLVFSVLSMTLVLGLLVVGTVRLAAAQHDGHKHHDMKLVGTNDLQARSTYQPTLHKYRPGSYFLFTGHHALDVNPVTGQQLPSFNPLTGKYEPNGVSIVDVSDPKRPKLVAHIPVGASVNAPPVPTNGGAQMVRVCDGIGANVGKVFMLRSYANSAHEIWNVTNPASPVGVRTVAGGNPVIGAQTGAPGALDGTHKSWWECDTGIAYIVGRRGNDTASGWRGGNHIFIFDLGNPARPMFLRDWALDGQQPGGVSPPHFTSVPSIHGPISTGPAGGAIAATGATADRVYFAYGTGSTGVMQIVDRTKLLPSPWGSGVRCGSAASSQLPTPCTDYTTAELGRWIMNPDNGAHTSFPLGKIPIQDFIADTGNTDLGTPRDIVFVTSEATAN